MENYKKIYEKYCNIKIPKGYDIHHIDCDHNNNDINNLVMLPKKLHNEYHRLYNCVPSVINSTKTISIYNRMANKYIIYTLKDFDEILDECNKWLDYREYLLGNMPNIHNLEV
jgi:hypothetical protein